MTTQRIITGEDRNIERLWGAQRPVTPATDSWRVLPADTIYSSLRKHDSLDLQVLQVELHNRLLTVVFPHERTIKSSGPGACISIVSELVPYCMDGIRRTPSVSARAYTFSHIGQMIRTSVVNELLGRTKAILGFAGRQKV